MIVFNDETNLYVSLEELEIKNDILCVKIPKNKILAALQVIENGKRVNREKARCAGKVVVVSVGNFSVEIEEIYNGFFLTTIKDSRKPFSNTIFQSTSMDDAVNKALEFVKGQK